MSAPRVSVVMAAYNVEAYVEAAVRSILEQSYTDFELIVIDDGSTDGTWAVLARLAQADARMRLERSAQNLGIARTRNRGTELARGEYIAVMDADDISLPERLEKQVAYLDAHPEIGVLGGARCLMTGADEVLSHVISNPLTPRLCDWARHFGPPSCHGASLIRRPLFCAVGGYRSEYVAAVDSDLLERMSHHTQFANIPDVVLHYRWHGTNTSIRRATLQLELGSTVAQRTIEATLGRPVPLERIMLMRDEHRPPEPEQVGEVSGLIYELALRFRQAATLTEEERRQVRQDAARRLRQIASNQKPWYRYGGPALYYAARLDPLGIIGWLLEAPYRSLRYRLGLGTKRLQGVRTS